MTSNTATEAWETVNRLAKTKGFGFTQMQHRAGSGILHRALSRISA